MPKLLKADTFTVMKHLRKLSACPVPYTYMAAVLGTGISCWVCIWGNLVGRSHWRETPEGTEVKAKGS